VAAQHYFIAAIDERIQRSSACEKDARILKINYGAKQLIAMLIARRTLG
jgi:hypothetical protein